MVRVVPVLRDAENFISVNCRESPAGGSRSPTWTLPLCAAVASLEPRRKRLCLGWAFRAILVSTVSPAPDLPLAHVQAIENSCVPPSTRLFIQQTTVTSPQQPGNVLENRTDPRDHVFLPLCLHVALPCGIISLHLTQW